MAVITKDNLKKLSTQKKIDIIFDYILKHKEQMFWNSIDEDEQKDIEQRKSQPFEDFDLVKKELLGE